MGRYDWLAMHAEGGAVSAGEGEWFGAGQDCVLRRMGHLLVEYKASFRAPIGVVCNDLGVFLYISF